MSPEANSGRFFKIPRIPRLTFSDVSDPPLFQIILVGGALSLMSWDDGKGEFFSSTNWWLENSEALYIFHWDVCYVLSQRIRLTKQLEIWRSLERVRCPVSINDSSVERESSELGAREAWGSPDELLSCPICPQYLFLKPEKLRFYSWPICQKWQFKRRSDENYED